jgi:hypothetical protein
MTKCYIVTCAVCGSLHEVHRRAALTCSTKCRVRLHRNPHLLDALREAGRDVKPDDERDGMFGMCQALAIDKLCPQLMDAIKNGTLTLDAVQPQVVRAFNKLGTAQIRKTKEAAR